MKLLNLHIRGWGGESPVRKERSGGQTKRKGLRGFKAMAGNHAKGPAGSERH